MRNDAAVRIFSLFRGPAPLEPEIVDNALHATFHPEGFRQYIENWEELAAPLIHTLHREAAKNEAAERLRDALLAYPGVPARWKVPDPAAASAPVLSMRLKRGDLSLAFFSTITTLATPQDVTLQQPHRVLPPGRRGDGRDREASRRYASPPALSCSAIAARSK